MLSIVPYLLKKNGTSLYNVFYGSSYTNRNDAPNAIVVIEDVKN